MTLRDIEMLAGHFFQNVVAWSKDFWGSIKSGALWKRLKIWWRANRWFAILSLIIATALYFRIRENINYNGSRSIPVEVQVVGGDPTMSVAVEPSTIDVFVRGSENDVRKFETSDLPIRLRIPADKIDNGTDGVTLSIKPRRDIPGLRELGLFATSVSADSVLLTYDAPADVEFFIDPPKHVGTPYHGEVKAVQFTPQSISLHGGRKNLASLRERDAVRPQLPLIEVENLVESFTKQYEIMLPEPLGKVATLSSPTSVTVTVEIVRREGTKDFEKLPVRLSMPPGVALPKGSRIDPLNVSAKVTGYDPSIASLSDDMVTAYAYVPSASTLNLSPGATNTLQVKLEVPHDKEIWTVEPTPSAVKLLMPAPPPPPPPPPPKPTPVTSSPAMTNATPVVSPPPAPPKPKPVTTAPAMTNATPVVSPQPAIQSSSTNSPVVAAKSATTGKQSASNDKTETKDNVENVKPKEQQ